MAASFYKKPEVKCYGPELRLRQQHPQIKYKSLYRSNQHNETVHLLQSQEHF
ncbi:hypothetical protein Hanom_Chr00s001363g01680891 [Helianthus anomalus]